MIETLKNLFNRDLKKVAAEIEMYRDEQKIWHIEKGIANSAGNLCLHITGNLHAYIGVGLARKAYVRKRELEFSLKDIPRAELIQRVNATMLLVQTGLNNLEEQQMKEDFPVVIWDKPTGMEYTLVHLSTHLNYHLGQINYHRRLLDGDA